MSFAKPAFDVGIQIRAADAAGLERMLTFWRERVGLEPEGVLPLGRGRRQHRHRLGDSVVKLNHARDGSPAGATTGITRLRVTHPEVDAERTLTDPEGNSVVLIPTATGAGAHLEVELAARDAARSERFYAEALGLERRGEQGRLACGASLLAIRTEPDRAAARPALEGGGYRYLTVQVHDCDAAHARALAAGAEAGMEPTTLGEVARISFVRDPDGNWIEISQRASLVGPP